jgi:hypothetical protein
MPVTVGEVVAVLAAKDTMTPVLSAAAARVQELEYKLGTMGAKSVEEFMKLNRQLYAAQANFEKLEASATGAAGGVDKVTKSAAVAGQSMATVENMAMRMIERMLIMYAMRETFGFVVGLFEAADALTRVSTSTELTVEKLGELKYSADVLGIPFEKITAAVETLDKKLADAKMETAEALHQIGFSFDEIFKLSPDQRLDAITAAIAAMPTQLQRTAAEMKLFGTTAIDPLVKEFASLSKQARDTNSVMSNETVVGLSMAMRAYREFAVGTRAEASMILVDLQHIAELMFKPFYGGGFGGWFTKPERTKPTSPTGTDTSLPSEGGGGGNNPLTGQAYVDSLVAESLAVNELTDDQKKQMATLKELNQVTADHAAKIGLLPAQYTQWLAADKEATAAAKASAAELKKWNEAEEEVMSAGDGWRGTLAGMNGEVVEGIKYYLQAGVSQAALARYYEQTSTQVKAVASELANETKEHKAAAAAGKQEEEMIEATTRAWDKYFEIKGDEGATDLQKALNRHEREFEDAVSKIKYEVAGWEQLYAAKDAIRKASDDKAIADHILDDKNSKESYAKRYNDAKEDYKFKIDHIASFSSEDIHQSKLRMEATRLEWQNWRQFANQALDETIGKIHTLSGEWITVKEMADRMAKGGSVDVTSQNFAEMIHSISTTGGMNPVGTINEAEAYRLATQGYSLAEIIKILGPGHGSGPIPGPAGPRIPGFAEGGVVMVGERGPEAVRLPFGSAVGASGTGAPGGGGHTVIMHPGAVQLHYPLMRDRQAMDEVGAVLGDAIVGRLLDRGYNPGLTSRR